MAKTPLLLNSQIFDYIKENYDIIPKLVEHVPSSVNDVYRISLSGGSDQQVLYFRISPYDHYFGSSRLEIEFEMLDHVSEMSDLVQVPEPIVQNTGLLTGEIQYLKDDQQVLSCCGLMTAVSGRVINFPELKKDQIESVGTSLQELHEKLATIEMKTITLLDVLNQSINRYRQKIELLEQVDPSHRQHLETCQKLLDKFPTDISTQTIHGDLWWKNVMINDSVGVGIIDFDFTMLGPATYDLAAYLASYRTSDSVPTAEMERWFLSCYGFDEREMDELRLMKQYRQLWIFGYWIDHSYLDIHTLSDAIANNMRVLRNLEDNK